MSKTKQIYMNETDQGKLAELADILGTSEAEAVRQAIASLLERLAR